MILHHFSLISLLFVEKTEKPYMTLYFTVPKSLIYGVSKILFLIIEDQDIRLLLQSDPKKLHLQRMTRTQLNTELGLAGMDLNWVATRMCTFSHGKSIWPVLWHFRVFIFAISGNTYFEMITAGALITEMMGELKEICEKKRHDFNTFNKG